MSDNRLRIWFSLFVLAVFCVGLAGGVLIGRRMPADRPFDRSFRGPREFGPPGRMGDGGRGGPSPRLLVERMTRDLDLTADQQAKIESVLGASRGRVETMQRDAFEKFDAERRNLHDEIRKVLTPDQQKKFDENEKEIRGRFGRRGPPPR